MDYKNDLEIDKFALDYEWEKQPSIFMKWAELAIEAQFERDKLKEQLELIRAQLDYRIREKAKSTETKITETSIQNSILLEPEYQEASSKYFQSIKNAKILDAAREAFEHKKKALEKMSELWISGYWSDPKISKEARGMAEDASSIKHRDALENNTRLKRRRTKEE